MAGKPLLLDPRAHWDADMEGALLPGCHHNRFLSGVNGEAMWNGPLALAFFDLWAGAEAGSGPGAGWLTRLEALLP